MLKRIVLSLAIISLLGGALAALADNATSANSGKGRKNIDLACMQNAVEKRDAAIISAFSAFSVKISQALEVRKSALKTAWAISDKTQRKAALDTAWKSWKETSKSSRQTLSGARKDAWAAFNKERRSCKASGASDDSGTEGMDVNI